MNSFDNRTSPAIVPKPRKMSTGGNRSWSEEEEAYLIQTRMQKMPYKHIAAHLKKTELACRLHYHQLSHGSHRRRRASTSTASSTSSNSSRGSIAQYPLPGFDHNGFQTHNNGYLTSNYAGTNQSPGRMQHKILLPKPSALSTDNSPDRYNGLRIDTNTQGMQPNPVDADRLDAIYNTHRSHFWSNIAHEYGNNLSAGQLEDLWRTNSNMTGQAPGRRPPTPGDSPNSRAVHNILKPSPFPDFYDHTKAYGMTNPYGTITPPDRMSFSMPQTMGQSMGMPATTTSYDTLPSLPRLDRQHSWSQQSGAPGPAISNLLNDDKPRQQHQHNEYCVNGRCFGN